MFADALMCGPLAYLTQCVRRVLGAICCVACIGPILFIVGIVVLVRPNTRKERVANYNEAVALFSSDAGDGVRMLASSGTAGTTNTLSPAREAVVIKGDKEGIDLSGESIFLRGTFVHSATGAGTVVVPVSTKYESLAAVTTTYSVPNRIMVSEKIDCGTSCSSSEQSSCTNRGTIVRTYKCGTVSSSSSSSFHRSLNTLELANATTTTMEDVSAKKRRKTSKPRYCIECSVPRYLTKVCSQFSFAKVAWENQNRGCHYPFEALGVYGSSTDTVSPITVEVRSDLDPAIALGRETKGSGDFGITEAKQRLTGILMIVFGLMICVFVYGGLALAVYCITGQSMFGGNNDDDNAVEDHQTVEVTQGEPVPQPGEYPQATEMQPQAYVGAPQHYQPQPGGYGEPQSGPPPAYGQPQCQPAPQPSVYPQQPVPQGYNQPPPPGSCQPAPTGYPEPPGCQPAPVPPPQPAVYPQHQQPMPQPYPAQQATGYPQQPPAQNPPPYPAPAQPV